MGTLNPMETPEGFSELFRIASRKLFQNSLRYLTNTSIRNSEILNYSI